MKTKMTCIAILLAFGFLTATANADQSYKFTLNSACKIGSTDVQPGDYKLVVGGPKSVLTHLKTGKSFELDATVDSADQKHGPMRSEMVGRSTPLSASWLA